MSKNLIAIDATPLLNPRCGIGRTTRALIDNIGRFIPGDYDFVLFVRRALGPSLRSQISLPFKVRQLRMPRISESLIRRLGLIERLCQASLYHASDFYLPVTTGTRTVATVYDVIYETAPENMVDHVRLRKWVSGFLKTTRQVITISEYSKREIINTYQVDPERVHVIYLGVDRRLFCPASDTEQTRERIGRSFSLKRRFFLAVSCSTGRKNTPFLLEAYREYLRSSGSIDLVLLWDPPDDIRHKYTASECRERIHFLGKQDEPTLRDLYISAEAVVFPSLCEGFGLPVLEAMSCGTPVITSGLTAIPEIGGDAAIYIDPFDTTSMVLALNQFEEEGTASSQMREKCLAQASRFSWEKFTRETLQVYGKALNE